jgi:hypothetical protein
MFRMPLSAFNKLVGLMEERREVEKFKSEEYVMQEAEKEQN